MRGEIGEIRINAFYHEDHLLLTINLWMVIPMKKHDSKYHWILDTYPETITKEQLYKLCHVSKKTAQHYLVNGIIPCVNTGKKTRQYTIRTVDVIKFLELQDRDPDSCLAPIGWYRQNATRFDAYSIPPGFDYTIGVKIGGFCHQVQFLTLPRRLFYHIRIDRALSPQK